MPAKLFDQWLCCRCWEWEQREEIVDRSAGVLQHAGETSLQWFRCHQPHIWPDPAADNRCGKSQ